MRDRNPSCHVVRWRRQNGYTLKVLNKEQAEKTYPSDRRP
ncbi:hypothetical protein [Thalassospira alkalitolerans]